MANTCTVCRHAKLGAIDEAILAGTSLRDIAKQFSLTAASVHRHQKHLAATLREAHSAGKIARADSLVDQLHGLQNDAQRILEKAEKSRDYRGALAGVRELSRLLQLSMKIGEQMALLQKEKPKLTLEETLIFIRACFGASEAPSLPPVE